MKIRLIIVTKEREYAELFYDGAASKRDLVDIDICTSYEKLDAMLQQGRYDVVLAERDAVDYVDPSRVKLILLLWNQKQGMSEYVQEMPMVKKYQRISGILSDVQGQYAKVAPEHFGASDKGRITAVWSPAGGTGKTSVALASAVRSALNGRKTTYLDLEYFSGTEALFERSGKSLSTVFTQLSGNLALQMQSIRLEDSNTNVNYFSPPSNYDDMNELTEEDILALVRAASGSAEELVVDLSSLCDRKNRAIFEVADRILLVVDQSAVAAAKLQQFMNQNSVFHTYLDKITVVANKGASVKLPENVDVVRLPLVHSVDPVSVYTTLSAKSF